MKLENFTLHAAQRLYQRTKMSSYELNSMLEQGSVVDLGSKPGINKTHYLFYSTKDDGYFVAVLDSLIGSIITVWLLDYHENLGWPVSDEDKQQAKELAENHVYKAIKDAISPSVYWLSVGYLTEDNKIKNQSVGKVPIDEFEGSAFWSFQDKAKTMEYLKEKVASKVDGKIQLLWFSFRKGKKGALAAIDLQ